MTNNKDYNGEEDTNWQDISPSTHMHGLLLRIITGNYQRKTCWKESLKLQFKQVIEGPDGREIEPDISYWGIRKPHRDKKGSKLDDLLLVIEIVHTQDNWNYSHDRILDAFNFKETLIEGFIYNYEKDKWWRFRREKNGDIGMEEGKDYSRVLGLYLHTLARE